MAKQPYWEKEEPEVFSAGRLQFRLYAGAGVLQCQRWRVAEEKPKIEKSFGVRVQDTQELAEQLHRLADRIIDIFYLDEEDA